MAAKKARKLAEPKVERSVALKENVWDNQQVEWLAVLLASLSVDESAFGWEALMVEMMELSAVGLMAVWKALTSVVPLEPLSAERMVAVMVGKKVVWMVVEMVSSMDCMLAES